MLTDDKLAAQIGPVLRAELAHIEPPADLLSLVRRRQARRSRARWLAVAAVPLAAGAAAAVLVAGPAAGPGGRAPERAPAAAGGQLAGQAVQLDGYRLSVPRGLRVGPLSHQRVGQGVLITGPSGIRLTIFLEAGTAASPPAAAQPIPAGPYQAVFISHGDGPASGGEMWLQVAAASGPDYLVARWDGLPAGQVAQIVGSIRTYHLRPVPVSCPASCG
ncbi:MAG TPA: hypothetical protein VIX86_22860 [Streptosporangiaceae bacterium]